MITPLPASDRIAVPWKNGGGVTREVCVFPPGAGMDDFDWRISMADVSEAGPFSTFPGIDRHLTVLEGVLHLDFGAQVEVLGPLESLAFTGEAPVFGTPLSPVRDLNVMTRRGGMQAGVRQVEGHVTLTAPVAVLIDLASLDALLVTDAPSHLLTPGPSILVELF